MAIRLLHTAYPILAVCSLLLFVVSCGGGSGLYEVCSSSSDCEGKLKCIPNPYVGKSGSLCTKSCSLTGGAALSRGSCSSDPDFYCENGCCYITSVSDTGGRLPSKRYQGTCVPFK